MKPKVSYATRVIRLIPYLAIIALFFYTAPLPTHRMNGLLFLLICLILPFLYGVNNSLNFLFPICVFLLYLPVVYNSLRILHERGWKWAVAFAAAALIGNVIGSELFKNRGKVKYIDWIVRLVALTAVVAYAAAVIASFGMMNRMTTLTYKSGSFGMIMEKTTVNFATNTSERLEYKAYSDDVSSSQTSAFSDATKTHIKRVCSFSLFPYWKHNYHEDSILDGHQYTYIRAYADGESFTSGSNAYPMTDRIVQEALQSTLD